MSEENVEVVRRAYDAWNREDLDAFLSVVHPDAEWGAGGGGSAADLFLGVKSVYRGHEGVREWWNAVKEPWDYFKSHVQRTFAGGDKVVTVVRFEAEGKESGAKVGLPFLTNVMEVKDGLIVRFNAYYSLEEALDAARLSEQDAHANS
jgi:ketosteroid isomerase-like protein